MEDQEELIHDASRREFVASHERLAALESAVTADDLRRLCDLADAHGDAGMSVIGERLRTQDNRCTADPAFCVQVLERIGPIMPEYSDLIAFHDHDQCETYYQDRHPEKWARLKALDDNGELPDNVTKGGYVERWLTVQICFTEAGCKAYLESDGHNLRHYFGVQIYAESFRRNSEMVAIRNALMKHAHGDALDRATVARLRGVIGRVLP